jgi:hypothetical protein
MYRVNVVGCHKPWRNSFTFYTEDAAAFDVFESQGLAEEMEFPEDMGMWDYLEQNFTPEAKYPMTIINEITVYTE